MQAELVLSVPFYDDGVDMSAHTKIHVWNGASRVSSLSPGSCI